jgi:predicted histidine transporter YuiF (NhaC family)
MWDIWDDEDLSTGEKLMSTLMNMAMILPTVGTLTDSLTKAMKKRTAESAKGVAADAAEIASSKAKVAQNTKETATLWAKAVAWMAAHPFLSGAVIAAAIAGLGLMASATGKTNKEAEKAAETSKKTADASREKAEASQEELTSV